MATTRSTELRRQARLIGDAKASFHARRWLDERIRDRLPPNRVDDACLAVSEVVTNAVRHSGARQAPVEIRVRAHDRTVRVEVQDAGPGFEPGRLGPPDPVRGSGYGLQILERVTDRWGLSGRSPTTVWFELHA